MQQNPLSAEFLRIYARQSVYEKYMVTIAWHIAPVYFSHKPSALINLSRTMKLSGRGSKQRQKGIAGNFSNAAIKDYLLHMGFHYDKDLNFTVLNGINNSIHLFCYKPEQIRTICQDYEVKRFLAEMGYKSFEPEDLIQKLKDRFGSGGSFPHEIGIFLGYPLEDVIAFIENKGRNYLLNGYWKVYSNLPLALKVFTEYDNARKLMLQKWL